MFGITRRSFDNFARRYFPFAAKMVQVFKLLAMRWVLARRWNRQIFFRLAFRCAVWLCHLGNQLSYRPTIPPHKDNKKR